jgi:hypothetical protein
MQRLAGETRAQSLWVRITVLVMCVLSALLPTSGYAQEASAAGLIVNYGDGRVSYVVVPFEEEQINGVELLERSGIDVVTVGFGGMGDAVCQIDDTGCSVDDCRSRMCQTSDRESPFWQFSKLSDDGEWQFVSTGASGARVQDGDIYAWSWTGTQPDLPVLSLDELADRAGGELSSLGDTALLRTEGGETGKDSDDGIGYASVAVVAVVVLAGGLLVLRSRRTAPRAEDA